MRPHSAALMVMTAVSLAMLGLGLVVSGLISVFGHSGTVTAALLAWPTSAAPAGPLVFSRPLHTGTHYDATRQRVIQTGSVMPLM